MSCLNFIIGRVFNKTASKSETDVFIKHTYEVIDSSWEEWKKKKDAMSVEEERKDFIRRMKELGCKGDSYAEAMAFLNKEFPNNARSKRMSA